MMEKVDPNELIENAWYEQVSLFGNWSDPLHVFQYKNGKRHFTDGEVLDNMICGDAVRPYTGTARYLNKKVR